MSTETDTTRRAPLDILMVEDDATDATLVQHELRMAGWDVRAEVVQTPHQFAARLSAKNFDLVLTDYHLPGWTGVAALELLQQMERDEPLILVSGEPPADVVAECAAKGFTDLVYKHNLGRLPIAVTRALELKRLREACARAEQRWRQAEDRYHTLAELSPDPLLLIRGDLIVFANGPAVKLLGAENASRLLGMAVLDFFAPEALGRVSRELAQAAQQREPVMFEAPMVRLDSHKTAVKIAARGLSYHDAPAVQLSLRDVSDRKRVTEAIQSLASFAQLNPNPVLEFSADGRLTYFNDAALAMARALGQEHPSGLLPGDTATLVPQCLATGQKKHCETLLNQHTLAWAFYPIHPTQVVHCYVTDITERLALEAQLRHSQRLESVGRLAAGVAHDFNNILTVIQGHTGLLRADPTLAPSIRESLQQVAQAAERASRLTTQLLTFSRKRVMQARRLDLNEVLSNVSMMLHRTLGEDIGFEFDYATDLPAIHADAGMMEQVIMNLAVNARDAMPNGGQLRITTALVDITPQQAQQSPEARAGRFVCLAMTDTGCGMDEATLSRIFEPFFTTKERGKGTGLGLAVVYGIVKQHRGWIEVQSQPGQGACFKIYLPPSERTADDPGEAPLPAPIHRGHETVLLVEDEAPVRLIVRNILERYGYLVLEAANGNEALVIWQHQRDKIQLLFTDMVMPAGPTGQELAEQLRRDKPELKVIIASGYRVEITTKGLDQAPGVRFLDKPFDAAKLALTVRQTLDA